MEIIEKEMHDEYERVMFASEPAIGYRGIMAIHSTALGPALGGTRFCNYASERDALTDCLRTSLFSYWNGSTRS